MHRSLWKNPDDRWPCNVEEWAIRMSLWNADAFRQMVSARIDDRYFIGIPGKAIWECLWNHRNAICTEHDYIWLNYGEVFKGLPRGIANDLATISDDDRYWSSLSVPGAIKLMRNRYVENEASKRLAEIDGLKGRPIEEQAEHVRALHQELIKLADGEQADDDQLAQIERMIKMHEDKILGEGKPDRLIPTGIKCIDDHIGGLRAPSMTSVCGRTAMGKTTFALNILYAAASAGFRCSYITTEMSAVEVQEKLISRAAGIPYSRIQDPRQLLDHELDAYQAHVYRLKDLPIHVWNPGKDRSIETICSYLSQQKFARGIDIAFFDMASHATSRNHERLGKTAVISHVTETLKSMSLELDIASVITAQINRSGAHDKELPGLHQIKQSGSFEEDSDNVIILHRPSYYETDDVPTNEMATINGAKFRKAPQKIFNRVPVDLGLNRWG